MTDECEACADDVEESTDSHDHHALSPDELRYPEFVFENGEIGDDGSFDLETDLDREGMADWLSDLAGGLASHDVAVESPAGYVTFGVGASGVEMSFDPEKGGVGNFEVTFKLRAKPMFVADDPDRPKAGARGGKGFIPIEMLTTDRETFRCYNWMGEE
ncbi:hypothetical protein [Haladaptatus cibarius]|uniref:hypothetical protein n=1 Tax=Haladaptatus cibarius TaxID=453847 RepID=UPI000679A277|nr:hypothetical protein [Haladaptatus cibarius]